MGFLVRGPIKLHHWTSYKSEVDISTFTTQNKQKKCALMKAFAIIELNNAVSCMKMVHFINVCTVCWDKNNPQGQKYNFFKEF